MEMHCYVYMTLISCIRNKKSLYLGKKNGNELNDFFVNIGSDLAKKIPVVDNISLDSFFRKE